MGILGADYIDSFLLSHFPYDYAKEPITYPRTHYRREYHDSEIAHMSTTVFTKGKAKEIKTRPKKCKPSLLEYHLRLSSKQPVCDVVPYFDYRDNEERKRYYGPKWILVTYYDDSLVNFIQVDIDRHGEDDSRAREQVRLLQQAKDEYGFEIVWTTSPGSLLKDGSIRHGLYAWIRLDSNHFVMDIQDTVLAFLSNIGLSDIVKIRDGAYLKRKKLVRVPGQYNVELADPSTFEKLHIHSPIEANRAFQGAWLNAKPLEYQILRDISLSQPPTPRNLHTDTLTTYTHSSVPLSPLPPSNDTFTTLLKWGRPIVNAAYPDESKQSECIEALIVAAAERLPDTSKTRHNKHILAAKAKQVITYLWANTDPHIQLTAARDEEDERRFKPHADCIRNHRGELLNRVSDRDREAAGRILDLMLKHNGRVAVVELYHSDGKDAICGHYRQWRRIRAALGIETLEEYDKPNHGKGTCRQYGFAESGTLLCVVGSDGKFRACI